MVIQKSLEHFDVTNDSDYNPTPESFNLPLFWRKKRRLKHSLQKFYDCHLK